jgi:hypothetical protein
MQVDAGKNGEIEVIKGEFCTDGKTFILTLAGTPLSGTGSTASAAFEDLMRAETSAGALPQRLKELARDQQGERVRATVIRSSLVALTVFGVVAGIMVVTAAMLPRVAVDVAAVTVSRLNAWADNMPPNHQKRISDLLQRFGGLMRASDACTAPAGAGSTK